MWSKIKLKVSRSRDSASTTTYDEQQNCVDDDVTLTRLSLRNSSDFACHSRNAVADEVTFPSSMVHGFSNSSFGSAMNQQQINGNNFMNNRVCSDSNVPHRFQTVNSEQLNTVSNCVGFPQRDSFTKHGDCEQHAGVGNCNGYTTDKIHKAEHDTRQVVEDLSQNSVVEPRQRLCSSPPKLMRREKVKTGEVLESRKSRLSGHVKNNSESVTCFPKPLELQPNHMSINGSANTGGMLTDGAMFGTAMLRKPDLMASSNFTSDGQISTEPSTAESTDSGIQPSLCSGNEDKGLNSSATEDDLRDDALSECFTSQNSDYMLLEDAKAMMASSLVADGSCTDYVDHLVMEHFPNANGDMTSDVVANHAWQIPVDYIPYCESITVLRRVNHNPVDERKVGQGSYCSKADYVPVDSSFAAFYSGPPLPVRQTVTRGTNTDSDEIGRVMHSRHMSDYSSKPEYNFSGSSTDNIVSGHNNESGNVQMPSQPFGFDVDSDDDSYLPPLPSRNYRNASERYDEDMSTSSDILSSRGSMEADGEEKTHMSWEEVMKEAHALGIPLSAPRSEVSDWKSSLSVASTAMSDCTDNSPLYNHFDYVSPSEHSAVAPQDKDLSNTSNSPLKASALTKCANPFKDKFKLHNLFSKKKNKKMDGDGEVTDSSRIVQRHSSAAAEIQRRDLPPLPPKRRQANGGNMSRSCLDSFASSSEFPRQHAHRTLSTLTLPAKDSSSALMTGSVWAGSSASVRSQSEASETGICSSSVSGLDCHRDLMMQGEFMDFSLCVCVCILYFCVYNW